MGDRLVLARLVGVRLRLLQLSVVKLAGDRLVSGGESSAVGVHAVCLHEIGFGRILFLCRS